MTPPTPPADDQTVKFVESLKRQWLAMIDALVDPVMIVGSDYRIIRANNAMALKGGLNSAKEIINQPCYEIFGNRKTPCDNCQMHLVAKEKTARTWTLENSADDHYVFYEITSQPLISDTQQVTGVVQVYRDRTEARQLQEQIFQAEKLASIGQLAGGVAHEINNPLGGIIVFSQMLMRELPENSSHHTDASEIYKAGLRCKDIVEELLDFAHQKQPDQKHKLEKETISQTIRSALKFCKIAKNISSIEIIDELDTCDSMVLADHNKLVQVFLNIIKNALHSMPHGGTLTLRSKATVVNGNKAVVIEIKDSGEGIPEKNIKKIFDPFFTTKQPGEGTGLGLSVCYRIIKDLDGEITLSSNVGEGTSFQITLPAAEEGPL
jgi:two-component system, NtrC family, sensor kinase